MNKLESLYVVGFPKSGNTWLARLIANVTSSKIHVNSKDDLINNSENCKNKNGRYIIYKIHGSNEIDKIENSKKVYILRDPRAVFVSGFFHNYRRFSKKKVLSNKLVNLFFNFEVGNINNSWNNTLVARWNRFKNQLKSFEKINVGSWSHHVNFWTSLDNMVIVRYEDLHDNTEKELVRILNELDISFDIDELRQIIQNESFESKKNQFIQNKDFTNAAFLRSGKKDDWKQFLDKKNQKNIENTHCVNMLKFNYLKK
ncbi:MAG: sulfotransferase domain-containing protein [Halarcobacter sp.]